MAKIKCGSFFGDLNRYSISGNAWTAIRECFRFFVFTVHQHPILIYIAANAEQLKRAFTRAKERELQIGIYTMPLFATKNEEGNLQEISKYTDEQQELAGIVVYGENKKVDKALDGLKFHP